MNQTTIREAVQFKGIGLHTGDMTTMKFVPAPADSGVAFVRTDLPGQPRIPATIDRVVGVIRGTSIGMGDAQVHTVEHVCSALFALGIDNVTVELDASEPPVADGSARAFAELLLKAGIVEQDKPKHFLAIKEKVTYRQNETELSLEPGEGLTIACQLVYDHPMIGNQERNFEVNAESYLKDIAPARTFCFDYEVEALKRKGLARGGSLDNAVVVGADRIYNKEKNLRFPDEFVRHKVLDLLGDLSLLGKSIRGKITAVKIGHGHNINFVKELAKAGHLVATA
ncbi:MAG: UDP-3-O-[3-hydroxymyristoyl] N-acetylglucosamine deacetylase [Elusimicrobia bacterium RIFCSPLOWO2_01_FULL_54_10]|nr:MAG: UDP-3-O-[3-hydroxymyristoyl] N-acetylglucosamine deacetylase [Elusimicrobia bacterium RIFCSPLOWO2_01_FULL_54_10]